MFSGSQVASSGMKIMLDNLMYNHEPISISVVTDVVHPGDAWMQGMCKEYAKTT